MKSIPGFRQRPGRSPSNAPLHSVDNKNRSTGPPGYPRYGSRPISQAIDSTRNRPLRVDAFRGQSANRGIPRPKLWAQARLSGLGLPLPAHRARRMPYRLQSITPEGAKRSQTISDGAAGNAHRNPGVRCHREKKRVASILAEDRVCRTFCRVLVEISAGIDNRRQSD